MSRLVWKAHWLVSEHVVSSCTCFAPFFCLLQQRTKRTQMIASKFSLSHKRKTSHWCSICFILAALIATCESFLPGSRILPPSLSKTVCVGQKESRSPRRTYVSALCAGQRRLSTREAKHQNRKQKSKAQITRSSSKKNEAISEEELRQHVSALYVSGPGGVLRESIEKAKKNRQSLMEKHRKHLNQLDRLPALVLNADYQVSSQELPFDVASYAYASANQLPSFEYLALARSRQVCIQW